MRMRDHEQTGRAGARCAVSGAMLALGLVGVPVRSSITAQTLVIANMEHTTAQLIDAASGKILVTLPTTSVPHEAAISSDGRWAVVTDYGGQQPGASLTVIDVRARQVARTISTAPRARPHGVHFLADNRTVVVTAERDSLLLLVDVVTGTITRTEPTSQFLGHMVAVPRDERTAFVANIGPGTLSIVDLAGDTAPVVIKVGTQTEGIGASHDGRQVWMGSNNTGKVYRVDVAARAVVDSIQTAGFPYRIAFTPDDATVIVTNPVQHEIRTYAAATGVLLNRVQLRGTPGPQGIAISQDGTRAWITMGTSNEVVEFEVASMQELHRWPVAAGPDGIGVAP